MLIKPPASRLTGGTLSLRAEVVIDGHPDDCFYSVPAEFAGLADTESSDCFLVGLLYPAMRRGEDIRVEGTVSARLLHNLNDCLIPLLAECDPRLKPVAVTAAATCDRVRPGARAVGTGFSGGIDSFDTIRRHFVRPEPDGFKLTHLFFFNVGAHGIPGKNATLESIARQFRARFDKLRAYPAEAGLPFVPVDSDIHKFHPWGHLEVATFATASAALFLQNGLRRYYLASAGHPYRDLWHFLGNGGRPDDIAVLNPLLLPWLSTETLDFVDDGTLLDRSAKTVLVADYPPAARHLNVCYGHGGEDGNCSVCRKCCRTLLTLEILGKLDDFSGIFDVEKYRREARRLFIAEILAAPESDLFAAHLRALARERGVDLRREVGIRDLLRARMQGGRLQAFIHGNALLRKTARAFFSRGTNPATPRP
ncbi:MAG: hypothetical protein IK066_00985 [Kiritimatiellae bacterium]|nr:hypothetical protein [Kiritimatiellia bacterium]